MSKYILAILALVVAVEVALVAQARLSPGARIATVAADVFSRCQKNDPPASCYEREIPKLLDRMSMEDVFTLTRVVQEKDPRFAYCHVLGHEVASAETRKDPSKWKDVVARCPQGTCSNGCLHGALQERFRAESLTDGQITEQIGEIAMVCAPRDGWNPTGIEQASCAHALGHLLMYATDADIQRSVSWCSEIDRVHPASVLRVCLDGAFMQLYQPLEPEDFELIRGKEVTRQAHEGFCSAFAGTQAWLSCYLEGWPLYLNELQSPSGMDAYCSRVSGDERTSCIESLTYIMVVQMGFDLSSIRSYCLGLKSSPATCAAGVATRLLENDNRAIPQAVAWCTEFTDDAIKKKCFDDLSWYASYVYGDGSDGQKKLCALLPQEWRTSCLAGEQ
jgi:hypothetical protein